MTTIDYEYLINLFTKKLKKQQLKEQELKEQELKKQVLKEEESIKQWFNNNIIKDNTKKILRSMLYPNYRDYCENNNLLTMKKCELFKSMNNIMGRTRKLNSGNIYYINYDFKEMS